MPLISFSVIVVAQPVTFTKLFVVPARLTEPLATRLLIPLILRTEVLVWVIFASVELTLNVVALTFPRVTVFAVVIDRDVALAEMEPVRLF